MYVMGYEFENNTRLVYKEWKMNNRGHKNKNNYKVTS